MISGKMVSVKQQITGISFLNQNRKAYTKIINFLLFNFWYSTESRIAGYPHLLKLLRPLLEKALAVF